MHIVNRRHLAEVMSEFPDAANEVSTWASIVEAVRWHTFSEIGSTFKDADAVDGYVIFNIRRNRYRLITVVHYAKKNTAGHVYIRSFLTHKQYDDPSNWDRRFGR